jgi:hypothetical protein
MACIAQCNRKRSSCTSTKQDHIAIATAQQTAPEAAEQQQDYSLKHHIVQGTAMHKPWVAAMHKLISKTTPCQHKLQRH